MGWQPMRHNRRRWSRHYMDPNECDQPGSAIERGPLPISAQTSRGITWDGGQIVVVDFGGDIHTLADATNPLRRKPRKARGAVQWSVSATGMTWNGSQPCYPNERRQQRLPTHSGRRINGHVHLPLEAGLPERSFAKGRQRR